MEEELVKLFYNSIRELDILYSKLIYDPDFENKLEIDIETLEHLPQFLSQFGIKPNDVEVLWAWSPMSFALSLLNKEDRCPYIKVRTSVETIKIMYCSDQKSFL